MDSVQIEALEVRLFLQALKERHGYDLLGYSEDSIRRRVMSLLPRTGAPHLGELQHRMLTDATLLPRILDGLTVQVSDMFRDPDFYRCFRTQVVPHLRTYPQIKIWHAGCSSGEEVYSTAIVLLEEGLYERTQLYATDISPQALDRAREAVYPNSRLRTFADNYSEAGGAGRLENYMDQAYDRIGLKDELKQNVFFFHHDLISDYAFGEMQAIFCRNVLLYLSASTKRHVYMRLSESLCHGGFLALGAAERIPEGTPHFEVFDHDRRVYRHWSVGTGSG